MVLYTIVLIFAIIILSAKRTQQKVTAIHKAVFDKLMKGKEVIIWKK